MSGVANAQWYGSVGSSFGEDNVGAFYKIGIETDSDDNFNVASEASLNFMYSNKFLRLAVIPNTRSLISGLLEQAFQPIGQTATLEQQNGQADTPQKHNTITTTL